MHPTPYTVTPDPMEQMIKHHHCRKEHDPPHRRLMTLLGTSMHTHHTGEVFSSLTFSFHLSSPCYIARGFVYQLQVQIQIPASRQNPHLFLLHHSCIGLTLQNMQKSFFIHRNIPDPLNYRPTSISRHHHMYTKIVQKVSVPPEVLVSLFDSYKSLVPMESLHFFLRTLLSSTVLLHIKSKHFRYAYIPGNQYRPRHLPTQSTLVGDGDRSPCLVTRAHIPCAPHRTHQIKDTEFIESFVSK